MTKFLIDDRDLYTSATAENGHSDICLLCDRYDGYGVKQCRAFPDGIPDKIWTGKDKHQFPFPNDRGCHFKLSPVVSPEVEATLDWVLPLNK